MMKSVSTALEGVDAILYVVNGDKGFDDFDKKFLDEHLDGKTPIVVALNKTDVVTKEKIFKQLEGLQQYDKIKAIVPVSAKKGENVDEVIKQLVALMPEGEKMYDDDVFTDKTMRFMASEIIREKALKLLEKEIPYGICVNINKFEMREDGSMYDIDADIVCEKDTHKPIIIGKKGEMLKKIATYARQDIEEMCGEQVYLTLWVRVKEDWRDSDYLLKNLGYDKKDI
jgi:GTP-binding protein Era